MQREIRRFRERGERFGRSMREEAIAIAKKRKEGYLGARVSNELRNWVIQQANDIGIPVSTVIRNILEDAFHNRENVSKSSVSSETPSSGESLSSKFPSVLGWENIRLNKSMDCSSCGKRLEAANYVTLGLGQPGEKHVVLCSNCKGDLM